MTDARAEELDRCSEDFGHRVIARPSAVAHPSTIEEVEQAVRWARERHLRVAARGQAHTTQGQSLCEGGLIIDLGALDRILEMGRDFVRVQAGARWNRLLQVTLESQLTPPVLTDYLGLSIGGTLSVGGVGGQSFRHGLQLDNVRELLVITGAGERVRCSREENSALFDACRGGLGRFGVIVEATLALEPAPQKVRWLKLGYSDLATFLAAQHHFADADYLCGNFARTSAGWAFDLDYLIYGDRPLPDGEILQNLELGYFDFANRLEAAERAMREAGSWKAQHPWMDLFVPASRAPELVASVLHELAPDDLRDGYMMTYPLARHLCHSPFPGLPSEDRLFLFDILPSFPHADRARLAAFDGVCERLLPAARKRGATVYPIGFPLGTSSMQAAHWREQLGKAYDSLVSTMRHSDPDSILPNSLV